MINYKVFDYVISSSCLANSVDNLLFLTPIFASSMNHKTHDKYSKKFMTELNEFIDSGGIPITRGLNPEERVQIKVFGKEDG